MSEILTYSFKHQLIPFHYRLVNQGADAYLAVHATGPRAQEAYGRAWGSGQEAALRNLSGAPPEQLRDRVRSGEAMVLTDVRQHPFTEGRILGPLQDPELEAPAGPIRLGAWFDGTGFDPESYHVLVVDEGAWPGGMGPRTPGGMTLLLPGSEHVDRGVFEELWKPWADRLLEAGFQGLAQTSVRLDPSTGRVGTLGLYGGWPWLHTHAFVSELENFPGLVRGEERCQWDPGARYVAALPVSVPPWPNPRSSRNREPRPIEGLTPQWASRFFWHDVEVDPEGKLRSRGLDGLLGVARGRHWYPWGARIQALQLAQALTIPEKQFRPDAGLQVPDLLTVAAERLGLVF